MYIYGTVWVGMMLIMAVKLPSHRVNIGYGTVGITSPAQVIVTTPSAMNLAPEIVVVANPLLGYRVILGSVAVSLILRIFPGDVPRLAYR